jgi:low temperature requirement protein LtrA
MTLAAISAGLKDSGNGQLRAAKIVLLYVGIIVEVVGDIGSYLFIRSYIRYPPERISERLACLSLIILGT